MSMTILVSVTRATTDENIEALILDNRWITIREVADDVGISFGSCQAIFTNILGLKRAATYITNMYTNRGLVGGRSLVGNVLAY